MVLVAIDGRQGYSIGVTFGDCIDLMADKFGCINASNMDGGNSTCMYLMGEAVNRSSNQAGGTRDLPNAWLVAPKPADYVKPENVPDYVVLPENALDERREYAEECDEELKERFLTFAQEFAPFYYGFFGSQSYDYYFGELARYVSRESDLWQRINLALMDRTWVNTWATDVNNLVLDGAYVNADGTYDIFITSDLYEHSTYWNYEANGTRLRITVVEDPDSYAGFLAIATY